MQRSALETYEERNDCIESILLTAMDNPLLPDALVAQLYEALATSIALYKDTGINTINDHVDEILNDESSPLRGFLIAPVNAPVNAQGERVIDAILRDLK